MKTADAWATECPPQATTAHKALTARIAAEREAWLAQGNSIKTDDVVQSNRKPAKWADFTISATEPKTGKRKSKGRK